MTESVHLRGNEGTNVGTSSEEWKLIQVLCANRDRLRKNLEYQPLEAQEDDQSDLTYSNAVAFFDSSLRDVVWNNDLGDIVDGELAQGDAKAQAQLKALCAVLDKLVDTEQAHIIASQVQKPDESRSAYKNLHALTNVLRNTNWAFEFVAGQGRGLFKLASETIALNAMNTVSKFSNYLFSLSRPSLNDIPPSNPTSTTTEGSPVDKPKPLLYPLQSLIGLLKHLPRKRTLHPLDPKTTTLSQLTESCPIESSRQNPDPVEKHHHEHRVLVKLLDSHTTDSQAASANSALHLFLSACEDISKWQECHCDSYTVIDGDCWKDMDCLSLCEEIEYAKYMSRRICLASKDGRIFALGPGSNVQNTQWRKSRPGYQPKKTLRSLLKASFVNASVSKSGPIPPTFNLRQRRALAAKLATGLSVFLGCGHTLKSWDPEDVYFLIASDGQYLLQDCYVSCIIDDEDLTLKALKESKFEEPISLFVSLARLLMEIEDGACLQHISDKELRTKIQSGLDQPAVLGYGSQYYSQSTDQDAIRELVQTSSIDRMDYLHAVTALLEFDRVYRRASTPTKSLTNNDSLEKVKSLFQKEVADRIASTVPGSDHISRTQESDGQPPNNAKNWSRERLRRPQESSVYLFDDKPANELDADDFYQELTAFHISCEAEDGPEKDPESRLEFTEPTRAVRIAVLDTGVNKAHPAIEAGFEMGRLRPDRCYSWVGENNGDVHDDHGHGTNATSLLLEVAPNADIYVAKVFIEGDVKIDEVENIAKAIHHAINVWEVDIISMSFGLEPLNSVSPILRDAYGKIAREMEATDKMFFAAAGNKGNNADRHFPAACEHVFCIHASTGKGKDGQISPDTQGSADNFMTLGIAVPFINMKDPKRTIEFRSGTSYATPIAAAIAAHVLYVAETLLQIQPNTLDCLRTRKGMREMFSLMAHPTDRSGYRYLAPWVKLWVRNWHHDPVKIQKVRNIILDAPGLQYSTQVKKVHFNVATRDDL